MLLQSLSKCQGCVSQSWGGQSGRGGQGQSEESQCACMSVVCIHNTHGCFFSLPSSLSPLPTLPLHTLGALTSQASLSQSWIFAVASFRLCAFFFLLCYMSQPVGFIVSPTYTIPDGEAPALVQPRAHLVSSSCPQMQQVLACNAPS